MVGLQENRGGSLGEFDAVGHGGFEGGHHAQIFRVFHENGTASGSQRAVGGDARYCLVPEIRKELLQVRGHVPVGGISERVAERRVGTVLPFEEFVADALRVAQDLIFALLSVTGHAEGKADDARAGGDGTHDRLGDALVHVLGDDGKDRAAGFEDPGRFDGEKFGIAGAYSDADEFSWFHAVSFMRRNAVCCCLKGKKVRPDPCPAASPWC